MQYDYPDSNGLPYQTSGGRLKKNSILNRDIPVNWDVKTLKEIAPVVTGKEDANYSTTDGAYKFFTCSRDVFLGPAAAFNGSSVLIAGNGDFNVKHYTGEYNAYQRTYVLIPNDIKYYAAAYLASERRISQFKSGSNGSIVKFITKGDVENIPIIIPDNTELLEQLNDRLLTIESIRKQNEELERVRDWLLPMLMNGQAKVES